MLTTHLTRTTTTTTTTTTTNINKPLSIGICALEKKTSSVNTKFLIDCIGQCHSGNDNDTNSASIVQVFCFKDSTILESPIDQWPTCDALLCYHSVGFPIERAIQYENELKSFSFNDIAAQKELLLDRQSVYQHLLKIGVPIPQPYSCVNHHSDPVIETNDYIQHNDIKIKKPFVEKPLDANDHNINIYYGNNGGCRKLFRKKKNQSSKLNTSVNTIRRDGTYLYEPFHTLVGGKDIKVYLCGDFNPDTHEIYDLYIHAEQRKSPSVDGIVERSSSGLEYRDRVTLTEQEVEIATKIMIGFGQRICGFDILRVKTGLDDSFQSVVCDVNGYSNVKHSQEFYVQCARIMYNAVNRRRNV
jgi:inositol hexakisphosphate/diphosphoinositol-pentakisphosphate kinase